MLLIEAISYPLVAAPLNGGTVMVCCAAVSKALANVMMCGLPLSAVPALLVRVNFTVPLAAASGSVKSREKLLEMVVLAAGEAKVGVWVVLSVGQQCVTAIT